MALSRSTIERIAALASRGVASIAAVVPSKPSRATTPNTHANTALCVDNQNKRRVREIVE
jgi:hypothetical protein